MPGSESQWVFNLSRADQRPKNPPGELLVHLKIPRGILEKCFVSVLVLLALLCQSPLCFRKDGPWKLPFPDFWLACVLVGLGCYSKIPHPGWLINKKKFMPQSSRGWKSRSVCQPGWDAGPLLVTDFLPSSHSSRDKGALSDLFYKGIHLIHNGSTLPTYNLSETPHLLIPPHGAFGF